MAHNDLHDLERFVLVQRDAYESALAELRRGAKRGHWMWYVFPQLAGLGCSATARQYAVAGLGEAAAYLRHPVLGARLVECVEALLAVEGRTAEAILGATDAMKLRSSATLFGLVSEPGSVFERLLEKYFGGEPDARTLALLEEGGGRAVRPAS